MKFNVMQMRPIFPLSHFFMKYSNLDHAFTNNY